MKAKDLTGRTFGKLSVIRRVGSDKCGHAIFECECSCPSKPKILVTGTHLLTGHTLSCGCVQSERASIAKTKWKTPDEKYASDVFRDMKKRCYNPKNSEYYCYGGKGIRICDDWLHDRSKFVSWAVSNGCHRGLEIDRVNNDGPYSPNNCRFVSRTINANNKSTNRRIEIDGITHTLSEWADIAELDYDNLQYLVNSNFGSFMDKILESDRLQQYLDTVK